jgi:hypothetical protein
MTAGEQLLDHFDRIAGKQPVFRQVSDEGIVPSMHVAVYRGFPEPDSLTAFTIGLSLFHPPGGAHKELMISMRDSDDVWALACGYLAFQLREQCAFICGDTINFGDQIAPHSQMSAFVAVHPLHIAPEAAVVDTGTHRVENMQLVPLYEPERRLLAGGGDVDAFLNTLPRGAFMDPQRKPLTGEF